MADMMTFPDTWEEFEEYYGFTDREEVYTNGARLISSFRVKQWLDHLDDYVPRNFHDKTCEAMAKAHQEEIADMVSVVRCSECKKSHIDGKTTHYLWCTEWGRSTDTFGFCERAERRE